MATYTLQDLLKLMSRLREPDTGCPWDIAQHYQSIVPFTLEEVYEVVDAIEQQDFPQLKEELGDLLFQVIFYSQLAREDGLFNFDEVVSDVTAKLLRRHPHVFPDGTLMSRQATPQSAATSEDSANIKANWEALKQDERSQKGFRSTLDDVPRALPAISRACKLQKRASRVGFDWDSIDDVRTKLDEELEELQHAQHSGRASDIEDELGDVFFTIVNMARHLKIDPETALRRANAKFEQRFRQVEQFAQHSDQDLTNSSSEQLEQWWQQAKYQSPTP